jgi:hypothetical protein
MHIPDFRNDQVEMYSGLYLAQLGPAKAGGDVVVDQANRIYNTICRF